MAEGQHGTFGEGEVSSVTQKLPKIYFLEVTHPHMSAFLGSWPGAPTNLSSVQPEFWDLLWINDFSLRDSSRDLGFLKNC